MNGEVEFIIRKLLPWLKAKKLAYEEAGLIPTLELLIGDLEEPL